MLNPETAAFAAAPKLLLLVSVVRPKRPAGIAAGVPTLIPRGLYNIGD